jgi:TetR/AcrR family transcriptional regulator, transcriptional repressor for nem operon
VSRYPADHKEKTREAILVATAQRLRSGGLEGVNIAGIMSEAGLTHGGFYAHFKSRDALLAAGIGKLFEEAVDTVGRFEAKYGKEVGLERYADFYLSPRHRDDMSSGCPIPSLTGETRRAAPAVRKAFDEGLEALAERLGKMMPPNSRKGGGRKAALALLGEMAGTLSVSRAIGDVKSSNELLSTKRKTVLA